MAHADPQPSAQRPQQRRNRDALLHADPTAAAVRAIEPAVEFYATLLVLARRARQKGAPTDALGEILERWRRKLHELLDDGFVVAALEAMLVVKPVRKATNSKRR